MGQRAGVVVRLITLVAALACTQGAWADGFANDSSGRLYRIKTRRLSVTLVGQVLIQRGESRYAPSLTDIALSPKHGMYGISFGELYRINWQEPGKSSHVGALGASLNGLAFDPDEQLFGSGGQALYRVDILTGKAKEVGRFGAGLSSSGDLAFIGKRLYAALTSAKGDVLAEVDPATGRAVKTKPIHVAGGCASEAHGVSLRRRGAWCCHAHGRHVQPGPRDRLAKPLMTSRQRFWGPLGPSACRRPVSQPIPWPAEAAPGLLRHDSQPRARPSVISKEATWT